MQRIALAERVRVHIHYCAFCHRYVRWWICILGELVLLPDPWEVFGAGSCQEAVWFSMAHGHGIQVSFPHVDIHTFYIRPDLPLYESTEGPYRQLLRLTDQPLV